MILHRFMCSNWALPCTKYIYFYLLPVIGKMLFENAKTLLRIMEL